MEGRPGSVPVVIGAGWSGIACAVELARQGHPPLLLDAAPQAGGRARAVDLALGDRHYLLDNGQHLMLGAYRETLSLLRHVGVDPAARLRSRRFELAYPDGWRLAAAPAPAPLHLALAVLGARGISWGERRALVAWIGRQRARRWRLAGADLPASALLADQPAALVRRLWRPLCLAALNVEPLQGSAAMLLRVLGDALDGSAADSNLLLPRAPASNLSALLPEPACAWLAAAGATVRLRTPVLGLARAGGDWRLTLRDGTVDASRVVLALPPARAAPLLDGAGPALADTCARLRAIDTAPIATVYLRYDPATRLRQPVQVLLDDAACGRPAQWVFDRGADDPELAGVLSAVVSGDGPASHLSRVALAQAVAGQLRADLDLPAPLAATALVEQRATIVPRPGLQRPPARLPSPGLYLAGDAADSPYPSTLEGSVRSGLAAATALLEDQSRLAAPWTGARDPSPR